MIRGTVPQHMVSGTVKIGLMQSAAVPVTAVGGAAGGSRAAAHVGMIPAALDLFFHDASAVYS